MEGKGRELKGGEGKEERQKERKGRDPGDGSISSWHFLGACSSSSTSVHQYHHICDTVSGKGKERSQSQLLVIGNTYR